MSLNTTTNGEPIQTLYIFRYDHKSYPFKQGFDVGHLKGYSCVLNRPYIPPVKTGVDNSKIIEVIKVDTTKMTARPIDDYFKKILFNWTDDKYERNYNEWRQWIKQYEVQTQSQE